MLFPREKYYSITELRKTFALSNQKLLEALAARQITRLTKDVNLGEYSVKALYYLKEDIDALQLPRRIK